MPSLLLQVKTAPVELLFFDCMLVSSRESGPGALTGIGSPHHRRMIGIRVPSPTAASRHIICPGGRRWSCAVIPSPLSVTPAVTEAPGRRRRVIEGDSHHCAVDLAFIHVVDGTLGCSYCVVDDPGISFGLPG